MSQNVKVMVATSISNFFLKVHEGSFQALVATCHHLRGGGAEGRGGVQRGVLVLTVLHQLEGEPVLGLDTLPGGVTLHQSQVRTWVT